jgi:hypothetical protein
MIGQHHAASMKWRRLVAGPLAVAMLLGASVALVAADATPPYYAAKIGPKTLHDKLRASGTFALTETVQHDLRPVGWLPGRIGVN